jgi:hypothetical protein
MKTADPRYEEVLAEMSFNPIARGLWPPERVEALRQCVELIVTWVQTTGQARDAEGLALINLATAGSIPQAAVLKVWQQQTGR